MRFTAKARRLPRVLGVLGALGALGVLGVLGLTTACGGDDAAASETTADTEGDTDTDTDTDGIGDGPWEDLESRPCPGDSFLTYENFGGPFMISHCTGCHHSGLAADQRQGSPPGVDFETIDKIRAQAPRIWARSGDQNATMPPVGPPGDDERALLGEWLACGAPTAADLEEAARASLPDWR